MKTVPKNEEPTITITPAMERFVAHNKEFKIVEGARLTPEDTEVITNVDYERSDRCRFVFDNGSVLILGRVDQASLPGYVFDWGFGE